LRNSTTAQALRYTLDGFNPTEDEFRNVYRLQKMFDDQFAEAFDVTDEKQMEIQSIAQGAAQQALNDEIKKTLGEQRFNEYQRAQDEEYKVLLQVADRFSLPAETASRIYDMKAAAERQKQAVENTPNLTDEQRQAAVRAISSETEKTVTQAMGEKVFKAYRKAGGQWISDLGIAPQIEPPPAPVEEQPTVVAPAAPPGFPPPPPGLYPPLPNAFRR
jgi:hypothetical protein